MLSIIVLAVLLGLALFLYLAWTKGKVNDVVFAVLIGTAFAFLIGIAFETSSREMLMEVEKSIAIAYLTGIALIAIAKTKHIKIGMIALILALFTLSFWIAVMLADSWRLKSIMELSRFTAIAAVILGAYAWRKSKDKFGLAGLSLVVYSILGYLIFFLFVIWTLSP